jgi:membrane-associated phospholipid phosphatase
MTETAQHDSAANEADRAHRWSLMRRGAALAYFAALAVIIVIEGVPTSRLQDMSIIVVGLAITCLGRGWRALGRVFLDWLPFTAVLMAYDYSRGLATTVGLPVHVRDVVDAEKWFFGGTVPTVWLQDHFYSPTSVHWYDALATLVYTSHFLATPILAAFLWLRERAAWLSYVTRVVAVSIAGLITYVLFPEAPPWLAAKDGVIPPVARLSARGWEYLHLGNVKTLLANAQNAGSNPVAAMPSLHTALATMVALYIGHRLHSRWRWLLVLYPMAMGLSLVYLGEHYVLDVVAGVLYALVVHWGLTRWERSRAARRTESAASAESSESTPADTPDARDTPVEEVSASSSGG